MYVLLRRQREESQSNTCLDGGKQSHVRLVWALGWLATSQPSLQASPSHQPAGTSIGLSRHKAWLHTGVVFFLASLKPKKSKCTCSCSCAHTPLVSQSQVFVLFSSLSALHKHFSLYAISNLIKQNVPFAALCPLLPCLYGAGEVGQTF